MPQTLVPIIGKAIVGYMFSSVLSMVSKSFIGEEASEKKEQYGFQDNTRSSKVPLPLIYGQCRVGLNMVYIGTSGTDNEYLHLIGIIGEGEIEGIVNESGIDQLFLDNKIYTEFGTENVHYEIFTGTASQTVCTTLNSAIPDWTDPLRYTAYLYIRLKFDSDKFQHTPNITLKIKGLKVYDPTKVITEYSNNPALCANDLLTRSSRRGGFGIAQNRIDFPSLESSRSYCVDKGWTCNMPLIENNAVIDNLTLILNNFRGDVIYGATKFYIRYKDLNYESTVMNFDQSNIISRGNKSTFKVSQPDIFDMPNTVSVTYLSEAGESDGTSTYKEQTYTLSDSDIVASEGDVREQNIRCLGLSDLDAVQKMANYYLERLRRNKNFTLVSGSSALPLEPLDLITITHDLTGWDQKWARVLSTSFNPNDFTVTINCEEEFSVFYDDVYNPSLIPSYDTILPNPQTDPSAVINVSHSEEVYYYRGRSFTRWVISFSAPLATVDPFFDYAEVYIKIGTAEYKFMTKSRDGYVLDPVEEGEIYYCKLRSVNIFGVKQNEANVVVVSKSIIGKTELPSDMTYLVATASGGTINVYGDEISDPDVSVYELRLNAWVGGVYFASNETPNFSRAGIKPGTFTLYCKPKDNSDNYSSNYVSTAVTIYYPANYVDKNVWSWDFTTGTHSNTEHILYDGDDALKCSHTEDILSGTWVSPEYDLGVEKTVKIWGDFLTAFVSSTLTWGGIAPNPNVWTDIIDSTSKWFEITTPDAAAKLNAKLKYGNVSGSYTNEIDGFEILAPEITARFIQVEVEIIDPQLDANLYLKELNMKAAYWS